MSLHPSVYFGGVIRHVRYRRGGVSEDMVPSSCLRVGSLLISFIIKLRMVKTDSSLIYDLWLSSSCSTADTTFLRARTLLQLACLSKLLYSPMFDWLFHVPRYGQIMMLVSMKDYLDHLLVYFRSSLSMFKEYGILLRSLVYLVKTFFLHFYQNF